MIWLVCWLIGVFLVSFVAGCSAFGFFGEPRLGRYSYIHRELYTGVPYRSIPIWVDSSFSEGDRIAIDDAVRTWNYALNGYVILNVVDFDFTPLDREKIGKQESSKGWLFLKIRHDSPLMPADLVGGRAIGFADKIGGSYLFLIRDRLDNEAVFGVTMHEIGHLLGSDHIGDRLMNEYYTRAAFRCIDYRTIWSVASYQNLPVDKLNYCIDKNSSGSISSRVVSLSPRKDDDLKVDELHCPFQP